MSTVLAKSRGVSLQTLEICLRQQKVLLCEPALSVLSNISPKEKLTRFCGGYNYYILIQSYQNHVLRKYIVNSDSMCMLYSNGDS